MYVYINFPELAPFSRYVGSSLHLPQGCYSYDLTDEAYHVDAISIQSCLITCLVSCDSKATCI